LINCCGLMSLADYRWKLAYNSHKKCYWCHIQSELWSSCCHIHTVFIRLLKEVLCEAQCDCYSWIWHGDQKAQEPDQQKWHISETVWASSLKFYRYLQVVEIYFWYWPDFGVTTATCGLEFRTLSDRGGISPGPWHLESSNSAGWKGSWTRTCFFYQGSLLICLRETEGQSFEHVNRNKHPRETGYAAWRHLHKCLLGQSPIESQIQTTKLWLYEPNP